MNVTDSTRCWYVPGSRHIIDVIVDGHTALDRETAADVLARYPGAIETSLGEAIAAIEAVCIRPPVVIDEERFMEMLEVLPPEGFHRDGNGVSFKLAERTNGAIAAIFARRGRVYYEMQDRYTLTHAEIMAKLPPPVPPARTEAVLGGIAPSAEEVPGEEGDSSSGGWY